MMKGLFFGLFITILLLGCVQPGSISNPTSLPESTAIPTQSIIVEASPSPTPSPSQTAESSQITAVSSTPDVTISPYTDTKTTPNPQANAVPFVTVWHSSKNSDSFNRTSFLILNQSHWDEIYKQILSQTSGYPNQTAPAVDFNQDFLIAAFMGIQNTGGHSIEIANVTNSSEGLQVLILETSPGSSCYTTQAITDPAQVIKVNRAYLMAVRFKTITEVHECLE